MKFADKVVVVLGGSAGIGLATAEAFAAEGARVGITARDADKLGRLAVKHGWFARSADLGSVEDTKDALTAFARELGTIDVLCVNAGVGGFASVPEVTEAFWDGVHSVNLRGAFFAIQSALPLMNDGGSVVITGSIGAHMAIPGNVTYAAAKAGLRAVARNVGVEALPRGIRVNMVSPGPTETEIFKRGMSEEEIASLRKLMTDNVPMGRMGEPAEVAAAIAFLASDDARFINGVELFVDGGSIEL